MTFFRSATLVVFLVFLSLTAGSARAADTDNARQFVDHVGQQVLQVLNGKQAEDQKQQQLRQLFIDNVDIAWMGRFVLGRAWQQASEDQRNRYLQAYKQYLLAHYTSNFADYTGSKYTITGAENESEGQIIVNMQIKSPTGQQQETQAGYRVRLENGQFKIADIIIEGVSLITTERSEFASVVQQRGMDGLISSLESKAQQEKKS